jgi:hypothetical protein
LPFAFPALGLFRRRVEKARDPHFARLAGEEAAFLLGPAPGAQELQVPCAEEVIWVIGAFSRGFVRELQYLIERQPRRRLRVFDLLVGVFPADSVHRL